jgi:penicillin-insensitive murein endopeptidase
MVNDGTSVSYGPPRHGVVFNAARLSTTGIGYWMPPRWAKRGLRYGTDEMVSLVVYLGRQLDERTPGTQVSIADLSKRTGGPSAWHRSHQTGRDVDIMFLARDARGKPAITDEMHHFNAAGEKFTPAPKKKRKGKRGQAKAKPPAEQPPAAPELFFDTERNWLLVKTLLDNPIAEIQYIFISDDLKQLLLDHATQAGESDDIIQRAAFVLHQPSDSLKHDDHMHVRIYCAQSDLGYGCHDFGVLRWQKKDYKYARRIDRQPKRDLVVSRWLVRPFYVLLSLSSLPFRGFVGGS